MIQRALGIIGLQIPVVSIPEPPYKEKELAIPVHAVTDLDPKAIKFGEVSAETGRASFSYVEKGIGLCMASRLGGIVTAPISKLGLKLASIHYPGHTEILAEMTKADDYAMMLAGRRLKVILVTIHCALREVAARLSEEKVLETILICNRALKQDFGIASPRIAVAGLNPHGGEEGMFGEEEKLVIAPSVEKARRMGIDVSGPYPPDTIFYKASKGNFHAVVCQYHDQGLIPFKLLHFKDGVNVTLGLPIVRTSVDHGTAYDIAGTGVADSESLEAAVELAVSIAENRHKNKKGELSSKT